jgi:hypothetical protein
MMRRLAPTVIGYCLVVPFGAAAAETARPEAGRYAVEVRLELPHLEDMASRKTVQLCMEPGSQAGTRGLAVLSDNNPLAGCPASNLRQDGEVLTFDIVCAGRNAARATARYVLAPTAFDGRISMQMGGKNMTMTEVQAGHRIGACGGGDDGKGSSP